jgi:hypothetical protein
MVFFEPGSSSTNGSSSQEIVVKDSQQKLCQEKPKLEYYSNPNAPKPFVKKLLKDRSYALPKKFHK